MSKRQHFEYPATVNPDRDQVIPVPKDEVETVYEHFLAHKRAGHADERFDIEDIRYVGAYVLEPTFPDKDTWAKMQRGGHIGYSLLKHEATEIQYLLREGVDPLDPRALVENVGIQRTAHATALMAEHLYLLALAHRMGFAEVTIGDLMLENESGDGRADRKTVRKKLGILLPSSPAGRLQARGFYDSIRT